MSHKEIIIIKQIIGYYVDHCKGLVQHSLTPQTQTKSIDPVQIGSQYVIEERCLLTKYFYSKYVSFSSPVIGLLETRIQKLLYYQICAGLLK